MIVPKSTEMGLGSGGGSSVVGGHRGQDPRAVGRIGVGDFKGRGGVLSNLGRSVEDFDERDRPVISDIDLHREGAEEKGLIGRGGDGRIRLHVVGEGHAVDPRRLADEGAGHGPGGRARDSGARSPFGHSPPSDQAAGAGDLEVARAADLGLAAGYVPDADFIDAALEVAVRFATGVERRTDRGVLDTVVAGHAAVGVAGAVEVTVDVEAPFAGCAVEGGRDVDPFILRKRGRADDGLVRPSLRDSKSATRTPSCERIPMK